MLVQASVISLYLISDVGHPYDNLRRLLSINLSLILEDLSVDVCRELYISQVVFGGVLFACIQAILMLRGIIVY